MWALTLAVGLGGLAQPGAWASNQTAADVPRLTLHMQPRPPYSYLDEEGRVRGLVAEPAARALEAAGIPFRWAVTPSQRQLALVQSGAGLDCGLGWFRTEAREALGRYSAPLYRDRPFAALVRDAAQIPPGQTARQLLADRRLRLLVKEGYSYGRFFDNLIERLEPIRERTHVEPMQMNLMLRTGRADWMILSPEEAQAQVGDGLSLYPLPDMPPGPTRHLYCSRVVPADWIVRVDAALPPLPEPAPR